MTGIAAKHHEGCEQSGVLRRQCAEGYTFDAFAQNKNEEKTAGYVQHVLHDADDHRRLGVLHPDIPSCQTVEPERGGCAPDADVKIPRCRRDDVGGGADEENGTLPQQRLQADKDHTRQQAYGERAEQRAGNARRVVPSESLGGDAAGAHAQEAENPVYHVEHHAAYRYRPDGGRTADVSDNGDVNKSQKRDGDV